MQPSARRKWVSVHKWIGITMGILFLFEALTGCLLVYQHELSALLDRPLSPSGPAATISVPLDKALAAAADFDPAGRPALIGMPSSNPDHAYHIVHAMPGGKDTRDIWVDPATGTASTGHRRPVQDVLDVIWSLHKRLAIPLVGDLLIAISGLVLTASTVSGLVLWWPRNGKWRHALSIKRGASLPRLTFDLHKVLGACLAAMCLLWGISGTYMIQPRWITGWLPSSMQPQNERSIDALTRGRETGRDGEDVASAQTIAGIATTTVPGGEALFLFAPSRPADCLWRVRIGRPDDLVRYVGSATVVVNACSRKVRGTVDERGNGASRFFYWLRPLHSGEALGVIGQFIVIWAGIGFSALGVSGLLLWWLRRRARLNVCERRQA